MEIKATLIHHLDEGNSIYDWTPMIFDTDAMEAWRDIETDDHWEMDGLMDTLDRYEGWLELRVDDPDGEWSRGVGRPDAISADMWLIPAALVIDEDTIGEYDECYGDGSYVVVTKLDA